MEIPLEWYIQRTSSLAIWQQTIDEHLVWRIGQDCHLILSHSVLLKIVSAVTLVWQFKKNRQIAKLKSPPNVPLIQYA